MSLVQRFERNTAGRDFAVGDIHGHFTRLQQALGAAGFDPARDRLFSVGDLVDRGPESEKALKWLRKPWFHAVQGNHEDMAIQHSRIGSDFNLYAANGGAWFLAAPLTEQREFAALFSDLPLAIEVETDGGLVGIVHADCPRTWAQLTGTLAQGGAEAMHLTAMCQWSRTRIKAQDTSGVSDVRAVVVGHTPVRRPAVLGNVFHIDTGGWLPDGSGYFTLLDLATLQTIPPMPAKLNWEGV